MESKAKILEEMPADLAGQVPEVKDQVREFMGKFAPLEKESLYVLTDPRTNARYCECHLRGSKFIPLSTIDVPLDPEEQAEYRANREIVQDHIAFERMKEDALKRRTFSNIVAEFTATFDPDHPLKIIGGQHRFMAIKEALDAGIDETHGLKIYFGLDPDQRLDVQEISNTNIAVSTDLFDRMHETLKGPQLREWCQEVGLLDAGQDFSDRWRRGHSITVKSARTFILNYFRGKAVDLQKFDQSNTTPVVCKTGMPDPDWDKLNKDHHKLWQDPKLKEAGKEFSLLVSAQRKAFKKSKGSKAPNIDFAEKAMNSAILSAFAYVAGLLHANDTRLKRHYALKARTGSDPLNAAALAKGKHKTDPENYRWLGYRTDPKERGRFVELFYLQAEKGEGIATHLVDLAIKKYHAKHALLEVKEAEGD